MAQFKSSASEGSFKANHLAVPDEVAKLQNEANRRIRGMNAAQTHLEKNREIFLQAQKQTQNIQQDDLKRRSSIEQASVRAQKNRSSEIWAKELEKEKAKDKYKVDTFGALVDFSKTAFDITSGIVKQNKDIQQKAINQISFTNKYSHEDILAAKEINSAISLSEFQRTNLVKRLLEEGKSQEYINTMHKHLIKGGGYRNYITNANVLRETAEQNAEIIQQIADDPKLTVEEKRKKIDALEAQMRGELTIDGVTPGTPILEQAYNPTMRRALDRIESRLNRGRREVLEKENERDRNKLILNAAYDGGTYNPAAVLDILSKAPSPDAINEGLKYLIARGLNQDQLESTKTAVFMKDGKPTTIEDGGYTKALETINHELKVARKEAQKLLTLEAQEKQIKAEMATNAFAQELATDDGRISNQDYRKIEQFYYERAGHNANPAFLQGIKRQTAEVQVLPVMREQLEERRLNNNLSVDYMEQMGVPKELWDQYIGAAQYQDGLRSTPQYKQLNAYLAQEITSAIADVDQIGFKNASNTQSHEFNWFVGEQVKKYRKQVLDLVQTGTNINDAMELIGNKAATESKAYLLKKGTFESYGLTDYHEAMKGQKNAQLIAQRKVAKLRALTPTQLKDPNEWLNLMGATALTEASNKLQETGSSEVLAVIAQNTGLTTYQVQHKIAALSDQIDPIPMDPNWEQIQNQWSPSQRYTFTSGRVANEQRLRAIQQETNRIQNTNSFPVRPVFQQGEDPPPEGSWTKQQVNDLAVSVGFPAEAAYTVSQIAGPESGMDPTNSTRRSGLYAESGEDSVGLMQINWGVHKDDGWLQELGIHKREDLFDPVLNMKAAFYLWKRAQGFGDWTTYTSGKYKNY